MPKLQEYQAFVSIYENRSITKAGRQLNLSASSISKKLSKLEDELSVQLVDRSTHNLSITPLGERFYLRCKSILDAVTENEILIREENQITAGRIRIALPEMLVTETLLSAIRSFGDQYPDVRFELNVSNEMQDLIASDIDFCFRSGPLEGSQLIGIPLFAIQHIFCATPDFLRRYPLTDSYESLLENRQLIVPTFVNLSLITKHFFPDTNIRAQQIVSSHSTNQLSAIVSMTLAGLGASILPRIYIKPLLDDGRLVQLYPDYTSPTMDISLIYHKKLTMTKLMTLFKSFIRDWAQHQPRVL
ncbi:LysR family transcriptional regulator [Nitrincola sp. MINF-07-Sa-05]|uniref:LysR family transcriptional regulator n=1 Tax=Nitrincola salilacus TaxID=3400273 RepID=UPI003917FAAA